MTRNEWIGEYWLVTHEFQTYKNEWIEKSVSLGKCLGNDEACDKAIVTIMRDFSNSQLRETYIIDGWGHLIYM
jgi:hypothetical protein